jgi:hypothetical protein
MVGRNDKKANIAKKYTVLYWFMQLAKQTTGIHGIYFLTQATL